MNTVKRFEGHETDPEKKLKNISCSFMARLNITKNFIFFMFYHSSTQEISTSLHIEMK